MADLDPAYGSDLRTQCQLSVRLNLIIDRGGTPNAFRGSFAYLSALYTKHRTRAGFLGNYAIEHSIPTRDALPVASSCLPGCEDANLAISRISLSGTGNETRQHRIDIFSPRHQIFGFHVLKLVHVFPGWTEGGHSSAASSRCNPSSSSHPPLAAMMSSHSYL